MAPVLKRPAGRASEVAKKQKVDPEVRRIEGLCDSVAKSVSASDDIPAVVAQMLTDMLPGSLGAFSDARHKMQDGIVEMIGSVLAGNEAAIQAKIDSATALASGGDAEKATRETVLASAEARLGTAAAALMEKKETLAADTIVCKNAKEAVAQAVAEQKQCAEELLKSQASKDSLDAAVKDMVKPLIENGTEETPLVDAKGLAEKLVVVLKTYEFDHSMIISIPQALLKQPATRGPFDTMVVQQLTEELNKRLARVEVTLQEAETVKAARLANVESAEAALSTAVEKRLASADAFKIARDANKEAETAQKAAQRHLNSHEPEMRKLAKQLDTMRGDLASLRNGAVAAYANLKERTTPPPEPEVREEEAPAIDEAEPAMEEGAPESVPATDS